MIPAAFIYNTGLVECVSLGRKIIIHAKKGKMKILGSFQLKEKNFKKNQCFERQELKFASTLRNAAARALNNFY